MKDGPSVVSICMKNERV